MQVRSKLIGRPNLYNTSAAISVGIGLGLPADAIARGIADLPSVPGRFQPIDAGQPFRVVVDYAHTDDALENVLRTARELTQGKVIVVFGCGGDRDRTKRPVMGEVAARSSDLAVVTSDNPRNEDPLTIIHEIETGLSRGGAKPGESYVLIEDRREAIRHALNSATDGDIVVVAGKGHEPYQVIGTQTLPFDDRLVVREVLDELKARRNQ
jgi:UDP-N-acetylmuramoyl-L-alanyl-D-glutamate--2,6-diaminopimelate ligase